MKIQPFQKKLFYLKAFISTGNQAAFGLKNHLKKLLLMWLVQANNNTRNFPKTLC